MCYFLRQKMGILLPKKHNLKKKVLTLDQIEAIVIVSKFVRFHKNCFKSKDVIDNVKISDNSDAVVKTIAHIFFF